MKVLHFCNSFSPLSETFIYDYIIELENQGVDNYVLSFTRENINDRPFTKSFALKDIYKFSWFAIRILIRIFGINAGIVWYFQRMLLKQQLILIKPNIIHAHFGPIGVLISNIALKLKIPFVVTFYGFDASSLLKEDFWVQKYKELWVDAHRVIVLSKNMRDVTIDVGCPENKISIVHLSRNLTNLLQKDIPKTVENFISVGRLAEKKGHIDTIKAFKKVIEAGYRINLKIIGDGPLKESLQNIITEDDLGNNIKLIGAINNEDTLKELYNSDAFILSSKTADNGDQEGTPTVLVESQAIGLPCISTLHAGIPEMIPHENYKFLAQEGNIEEIKNCIINLIQTDNNELKEIVKRGRKIVEKEFNLETEVNKLITLYNGINKYEK